MPSSSPSSSARARRFMSPTTLRDLELSPVDASAAVMPRRRGFPAPPTGHELMALFPPPPPPNPIMGSTSGLFVAQERAFFACKGKEIVAVQIEADIHAGRSQPHPHAHSPPHPHPHSQPPAPAEQTVRQTSRSPHIHPGHGLAPPPQPGPPPPTQGSPRAPRGIPVPALSASVSPLSPYPGPAPPQHARTALPHAPMDVQMQYPMHPPPPPPQQGEEHGGKQTQQGEEDEARRRPVPHNERRRAGTYTKRVVVVK